MLRPRLIETGKFYRYRYRDLSRLKIFKDVETETNRDWEISYISRPRNVMVVETKTGGKDVETETLWRVSLISAQYLCLIVITQPSDSV